MRRSVRSLIFLRIFVFFIIEIVVFIVFVLVKIIVFKFRRRKNYRRKSGHRQPYTAITVTGIKA